MNLLKQNYESKYKDYMYDERKFGYPVFMVTEDYHFTTNAKNEHEGIQSLPNRKLNHQMETFNNEHVQMRKQRLGIEKKIKLKTQSQCEVGFGRQESRHLFDKRPNTRHESVMEITQSSPLVSIGGSPKSTTKSRRDQSMIHSLENSLDRKPRTSQGQRLTMKSVQMNGVLDFSKQASREFNLFSGERLESRF